VTRIAALYVETGGAYFDLPDVNPWDEARDARLYAGPYPVVAHPPCQRWGRFWHGSTRKPHQYQLGDDAGCFAAALASVKRWGGVLEHPAHSRAWEAFGLNRPPSKGGWVRTAGGWTCHVEQGFYGHASRKPTWLFASGVDLPDLRWGRGAQRIPEWMHLRASTAIANARPVPAPWLGPPDDRIHKATPGEDRANFRSATPMGFARATFKANYRGARAASVFD
jgi:hypothetical protein